MFLTQNIENDCICALSFSQLYKLKEIDYNMSVFDDIFRKVLANFSGWVRISDSYSNWTIESFEKVNYDEKMIKPHCIDCVIVNQCWFVDEENKRPIEFDYSQYPEIPLSQRGLYHPKCHDKTIPILAPNPSEIEIFDLERKKNYLISNKLNWLKAMGYNEGDVEEIIQLIKENRI